MIVVYWMDHEKLFAGAPTAGHFSFDDSEFMNAMKFMESLRKDPKNSHVGMVSEFDGSVGKPGVDAVEGGKTPDGHDYEWSKQHRGAGPRK